MFNNHHTNLLEVDRLMIHDYVVMDYQWFLYYSTFAFQFQLSKSKPFTNKFLFNLSFSTIRIRVWFLFDRPMALFRFCLIGQWYCFKYKWSNKENQLHIFIHFYSLKDLLVCAQNSKLSSCSWLCIVEMFLYLENSYGWYCSQMMRNLIMLHAVTFLSNEVNH